MSKPIKDYTALPGYATKDFVPITASIDEEQGVVEAIVAVMGNIDHQGDIIIPGAFAKTIVERGSEVLVLDNHRTDSNEAILGKMLALREIGRGELPTAVTEKYPEATGGLLAKMQFLLQTPEGKGIFERIKAKAVKKYSIGYDPLQKDFETLGEGDDRVTIRNLREIRLWEVSVVPFAANEATMTVSAKTADDNGDDDAFKRARGIVPWKDGDEAPEATIRRLRGAKAADPEPSEGKPWRVEEREGEHCVFKLDADGNLDGEALKCYSDEADAVAYLRALYVNVEDAGKAAEIDEDPKGASADPELKEGRVLSARNATRIGGALAALSDTLESAGLDVPQYAKIEGEEEEKSSAPAKGRADDDQPDEKAGPGACPPTNSDMLAQVKLLELELSLLEVT